MSRRKTKEEFIEQAKEVHGNKYDYSLVEYKNKYTKVKIICKNHGIFEQMPMSHLKRKGCFYCYGIKKLTTYDFINKSNIIHNNKYDYSLVEYVNNKTKVKINCDIHGIFSQSPDAHLLGMGCYKCGVDRFTNHNKANPMGWCSESWGIRAKKSIRFDSFKVYIIQCWNDNEEFYKIGRTFLKTKIRFSGLKNMPYQYEVLHEFVFDTAKEAFDKETELKRLHKEYKYLPKIKFNGVNECFSEIKIRD